MAAFKSNQEKTNKGFTHIFEGITKEQLTEQATEALQSNGYKLIEGTPDHGTYEKGNRTMRILLGAFVAYHKFGLKTAQVSETETSLQLLSRSSGMSGGAIGMQAMKKEVERLSNYFASL